ncbi:hypothetical protein EYF80_003460 [Liparis tanakae]|uniref:Uncharacterized protein n=1 Tax=Liparis tanakae TaxID=230148 RepID=A0A4Z2J7Q4_9TELE|nr:hypothetical protein EYF80_003460 [Liparis tanakae]
MRDEIEGMEEVKDKRREGETEKVERKEESVAGGLGAIRLHFEKVETALAMPNTQIRFGCSDSDCLPSLNINLPRNFTLRSNRSNRRTTERQNGSKEEGGGGVIGGSKRNGGEGGKGIVLEVRLREVENKWGGKAPAYWAAEPDFKTGIMPMFCMFRLIYFKSPILYAPRNCGLRTDEAAGRRTAEECADSSGQSSKAGGERRVSRHVGVRSALCCVLSKLKGGFPTNAVSPATLEPNVGPPGTQVLEGMQPEEELMSSLDGGGLFPVLKCQSMFMWSMRRVARQLLSLTRTNLAKPKAYNEVQK